MVQPIRIYNDNQNIIFNIITYSGKVMGRNLPIDYFCQELVRF